MRNPIPYVQPRNHPAGVLVISKLAHKDKLRLLPLIAATYFMVSGGPYGLEDIIGLAGYKIALVLLAVVPFFWSLPTALMVGELASAMPAEGGFYVWVKQAMGPFWGFQEAWLSLAASVFDMAIYPTTFVLYLGHAFPSVNVGHRGFLIKVSIVAIAAAWNLMGAATVGRGSVGMACISLSPFVVLIGVAIWKTIHGGVHLTASPITNIDLGGALSITLWNYMGWDNASTVAQEVDDPQSNYPRAMFASAISVACVYMLPLIAVWMVGIPASRFSTGAWADAASLLAGPVLLFAVVCAGSLDGLGTFNALTLTLTRLPYAMAEDGFLPKLLTKRTRKNVPWVSVLLCATGWALALTMTFERLISIDLVLYGGALILEFIALAMLRKNAADMHRPFRVPGPNYVAYLIGIGPTVLIAFAIYSARNEQVAGINALLFSTLVALAGAVIFWSTSRLHRKSA